MDAPSRPSPLSHPVPLPSPLSHDPNSLCLSGREGHGSRDFEEEPGWMEGKWSECIDSLPPLGQTWNCSRAYKQHKSFLSPSLPSFLPLPWAFHMLREKSIMFISLLVINCLLHFQVLKAEYPANSLKCMSSLTRPDNRLICPRGRNVYCVKEVSSLKQDLCGKTQYFGDTYVNEECQFKKCADKCTEGEYQFEFGGNNYTRRRFCCNDNHYCNTGSRTMETVSYLQVFFLFLITFFLAYWLYCNIPVVHYICTREHSVISFAWESILLYRFHVRAC